MWDWAAKVGEDSLHDVRGIVGGVAFLKKLPKWGLG